MKNTRKALLVLLFLIMPLTFASADSTSKYAVDVEVKCSRDMRGEDPVKSIYVGDTFYLTIVCGIRQKTGFFTRKPALVAIAFAPASCVDISVTSYSRYIFSFEEYFMEELGYSEQDLEEILEEYYDEDYSVAFIKMPISRDGNEKQKFVFKCTAKTSENLCMLIYDVEDDLDFETMETIQILK